MVEWLMAHKIIALVGIGVLAASAFIFMKGGPGTGGVGLGGVTPGSGAGADPLSSQLTGLQEQLSNMMAGISAQFGGGTGGSGSGATPTGGTTTTPTTTSAPAPVSAPLPTAPTIAYHAPAPVLIIPASVVKPLPVSADAWQPPVAHPAAQAPPVAIAMASQFVPPPSPLSVPGAYLGRSLGEGQYAKAPTGPAIIAQLRRTPILPAPSGYYTQHAYAQAATASPAYAGVSMGEGQYIHQAPPPPVESVTHGRLTSS